MTPPRKSPQDQRHEACGKLAGIMKLHEYARYDAVGLMELIARGEITPFEAQACALEAIERLNPVLNFVAGEIDAKPAWVEGRPFSGLPFLVKEGSGVRGFPQFRGCRLGAGLLAPDDIPVSARQRATGVAI